MNKKTIALIILLVIGVFGGGFFIAWYQDKNSNEYQNENFKKTFNEIVVGGYFSAPEEIAVSFGELIDQPDQIGDYEETVKNKEALLLMEYRDADGQIKEVYSKVFDLNNENIAYTLKHFTNYFEVDDFSQIQYHFKFNTDKTKKAEYLRRTNSGTILISDNRIVVLLTNEKTIDSFVQIFKEHNSVQSTLFEYLENNPNILDEIDGKVSEAEQKITQAEEKIPEELKSFAQNFWNAWISLDTEELSQYYAPNVRFYAGDEWYEEWGMQDPNKDKIHAFVSIEQNRLLDAYVELKKEDFEEEYAQSLKATNTLALYPANDFLELCYAEDKADFFDHFGIAQGDTIMTVRLDGGDTCTVEGNFLAGEIRFFVIRDIEGVYKVVTDFTE